MMFSNFLWITHSPDGSNHVSWDLSAFALSLPLLVRHTHARTTVSPPHHQALQNNVSLVFRREIISCRNPLCARYTSYISVQTQFAVICFCILFFLITLGIYPQWEFWRIFKSGGQGEPTYLCTSFLKFKLLLLKTAPSLGVWDSNRGHFLLSVLPLLLRDWIYI